jgi:hypothetical protein
VVRFNSDGYDDLSVSLDDGTLKLFLGGGLGGLLDSAPRTSPRMVEDITLDACVDERDYEILEESYGYRAGEGADVRADFNTDGWVDFFDYLLLIERWRQGIGCGAFHG